MTTAVRTTEIRRALQRFDFKTLFVEELGWDIYRAAPLTVEAGGKDYTLRGVAEKRGAVAFVCEPDASGGIPNYATRKKIDTQLGKAHHEHVIIYVDRGATRQIWQWVRRRSGRPTAYPEQPFYKGQSGEALVQRLRELYVDLNQEERLTLPDVTERLQKAFDVEKVTKRFYDRFKTEHAAFLKAIEGIGAEGDREWYASLMLNRLMFTYFIQRKGFLDGDANYLRNRLQTVRQRLGADKFHSFYRSFLLRLFHEGLGQAPAERSAEVAALLGAIPYLNGGLFEMHAIEKSYRAITIPDEAFQRVFDFFDAYQWHLDEREMRADNEINPDVLGYIFEKYINQKQMGAYYTKEDITDYIGKNTILPFLFDAAREKCKVAFEPGGEVWRLLRDDPDRYLYEAVRKGVDLPLPPEIEAGVADVSKRGNWNRPADSAYALPTETWREHVARRTRCLELRAKLANGEVTSVNDLITYNLNITCFAQDVIERAEGPELLRAFWQALAGRDARNGQPAEPGVTVLDPTCGSGAFLFAALNLLEPLYEACLTRMQAFVADFDRQGERGRGPDFRETLARMNDRTAHPNQRYFILKSIIVNNLYGVDIMEEAVEIAKLRLFLKLVAQSETVAQVEPLPDIDFNIRCGNTLVGFATLDAVRQAMMYGPHGQMRMLTPEDEATLARIDEQAEIAARAYARFREMQSARGMNASAFRGAKETLRERLAALRDELDSYLAREYGIAAEDDLFAFAPWRASHQPFHWFVEFYGIVHARGGFDVIIGNPPYISTTKARKTYTLKRYRTNDCPDIYANVLERCTSLLSRDGSSGLIVPLSVTFSSDFASLRSLLYERYQSSWFSSFARIPSALFSADVRVRNTIHIGRKDGMPRHLFSSVLHRWFADARAELFNNLTYSPFSPEQYGGLIPRYNTPKFGEAIERCISQTPRTVGSFLAMRPTANVIHYKKSAYNWLTFCTALPPSYNAGGSLTSQTQFGTVYAPTPELRDALLLLLNGKLLFAYWSTIGDDFHVANWMFATFHINLARITDTDMLKLRQLASRLEDELQSHVSFKLNAGKRVGTYNLALCRDVTDQSDTIFARYLGLSEVQEDIELLYAQIVKTNFEEDDDDAEQ